MSNQPPPEQPGVPRAERTFPAGDFSSAAGDARVNILLVDDEPKNLTVLETILNNPDYRLVRAESADQALLALVVEEFALIVLDIHLPGMSGFELAHMIKQRKKTAAVPIIFLTAYYSEDQHVLEGYETGAVDYLHKPVNGTILRSKVAVFVELHRRTRESLLANRALFHEVTERRRVQEQLVELNSDLELRIRERTSELAGANAALRDSEERLRFLDDLSEALRSATDAGRMMTLAVRILGERLGAERCGFAVTNHDGSYTVRNAWSRGGTGESLPRGEHLTTEAAAALRAGRTVTGVNPDGDHVAFFPIRKEGRLAAVVAVERTADQAWRESEIALANEVIERAWTHYERARMTASLAARERELQTLADNVPDILTRFDRRGCLTFINAAVTIAAGIKPAEWIGKNIRELGQPQELVALWLEAIEDVFSRQVERLLEFTLNSPTGLRYYSARLVPERTPGGAVECVLAVTRDITEQKIATASLEEANRHKDEFLAMLGHELRNPLAPIRNAVSILGYIASDDPDLNWCRDVIDRQTRQLTRLVDDLLDVSRVSRGKIQLELQPVELQRVVQQAVETSRPLIDSRDHKFTVAYCSETLFVTGDCSRLAQVVSNILNNAAKYTDEGGRIDVVVEHESTAPDFAAIRIRDNGRGFDESTRLGLFKLFYQGTQNLARSDGGLGVGLALVRSLVEMHQGSVEARSEGVGRGSEFVIRLPCWLGRPPATPTATDDGLTESRDLSVLVVDDNVDSARTMTLLLQRLGHRVIEAHDGEQAVESALRQRPDVVLLDIGLPKLDGLQVCRKLRTEGLSEARIIAMTGYGQEQDRRLSQEAGFDSHLVKPITMEELQRALTIRLDDKELAH